MIQIYPFEIGLSFQFAWNNSKYITPIHNQRNNKTEEYHILRHAVGKIGEFGARRYLIHERGVECTAVQFIAGKTYEDRIRMFVGDCDLRVKNNMGEEYRVHVKTCFADSAFDYTWAIQETDKAVTEPSEDDYFIFMRLTGFDKAEFICMKKASEIEWEPTIVGLKGKLSYYLKGRDNFIKGVKK
jgi:hypothetical protein